MAKLPPPPFRSIQLPCPPGGGGAPAAPDPELAAVREALAAAKGRMDPHAGRPALARVLRAVDLYAPLRGAIAREAGAQAVTNAWLKLYEILAHFRLPEGLLAGRPGPLRAFFNAELPGAFVSAANHYLAAHAPAAPLEWVASSLHPGEGGAVGDHFGLYAGNPGRWLMGPRMRGDVTRAGDLRALAAGAAERLGGKADLYTSDAGIDVSGDYNAQERLTARIHLGQIVAGLLALRAGGALVVKTYTFTEPYSVALLALLAGRFEALHVAKPRASRPTNSEVYLVALGLRAEPPPAEREALLRAVEAFDFARPVGGGGGPAFRQAVRRAARQFHLRDQARYLGEAMGFLEKFGGRPGALAGALAPSRRAAQAAWRALHPLPPLGRPLPAAPRRRAMAPGGRVGPAPPAESDGPPAESDGPPAESDAPPAESDGPPAESDAPPAESDGPPAESDDAPSAERRPLSRER